MVELSNAPSFNPVQSIINQCVEKHPVPTQEELRVIVELKNVDPQPVEHHLVCKKCNNLALKPSQCSNQDCEVIFCDICIIEWLKKSDKCPSCDLYFKPGKIAKIIRNLFESKTLTCTTCNQSFAYNAFYPHLLTCLSKGALCPLDCGSLEFFKSVKDLMKHLE